MEVIAVTRETVTLHHEGELLRTSFAAWRFATLPNGEPDEAYLISPPVAAKDGEHTVTVPLTAPGLGQRLHVLFRGKKAGADALKAAVEAAGGTWSLNDQHHIDAPPILDKPPIPSISQQFPPPAVMLRDMGFPPGTRVIAPGETEG
jgi:hypothetical protein